jgi:archaellum biogenesis protein FlaJ (TadC family)
LKKKEIKEMREWTNTGIQFVGIIIALFTLVAFIWVSSSGITELEDINVNLKNFTSDTITTGKVMLITPNGTGQGCIKYNGTATIIGNGPC